MKCFLINVGHIVSSVHRDIQSMSTIYIIILSQSSGPLSKIADAWIMSEKKKKKDQKTCHPPKDHTKNKKKTTNPKIHKNEY